MKYFVVFRLQINDIEDTVWRCNTAKQMTRLQIDHEIHPKNLLQVLAWTFDKIVPLTYATLLNVKQFIKRRGNFKFSTLWKNIG